MKTKIFLIIIINFLLTNFLFGQNFLPSQSDFDGTWKWNNNQNETLYVYITTDRTENSSMSNSTKYLNLDYQLENNETILFNSKIKVQGGSGTVESFLGMGGNLVLNEENNSASGLIIDTGEDAYEGLIKLKYMNPLGQEPYIIWELNETPDKWISSGETDSFTLPKSITLTKAE